MTASGTGRPRTHTVSSSQPNRHHAIHEDSPGKDIFVFCDGTGKDGRQAEVNGQKRTNIYHAYELVKKVSSHSRPRERFYVPGVGAGSAFKNPMNLLSRIFGGTIVESIVTAYLHISQNYQVGDDLYLFGYSRGAFVARKVASLIYRMGLDIQDRATLLKRWGQHEKPVPWNSPASNDAGKDTRIKCLVAWDTVGNVFSKTFVHENDLLGIPDSELPPNVDYAFHAMAFHENRKLFRATLFDANGRTKLKEVWFPGAHADVGGGDKYESGLPNISLLWVLGEMAGFMKIRHEHIDYPDLNTVIPTDAYHNTSAARRVVDKCETRLESKLLKANSLIHESVAYLRNTAVNSLDPRPRRTSHILTINDLSTIQWDGKAYLVTCNTLETLKRSATMTRRMIQDQYRTRVSSLRASVSNFPGRTPRSSSARLPPSTLREPGTPRPLASSTFIPKSYYEMQTPVISAPTSRHRTDSTVSRHGTDSVSQPRSESDSRHHTDSVSPHRNDSTSRHHNDSASRHRTDSVSRHRTDSVSGHRTEPVSRHRTDSVSSRHHLHSETKLIPPQWPQLDPSRGEGNRLAVPGGGPPYERRRRISNTTAQAPTSFMAQEPIMAAELLRRTPSRAQVGVN